MYQSFYWYLLRCGVSKFREAAQEPTFDVSVVHAECPQGQKFIHQLIVIILHLDIAFHERIAQTTVGLRCGLGNFLDFDGIVREGFTQFHDFSAFIRTESTGSLHELLTYEYGARDMINKHFLFLHFCSGVVLFFMALLYFVLLDNQSFY